MTPFLITIIVLALIFDYINGFHDAANSIATVVSTKVLTPFQAVLWAALFNSVAYFIFKDHGVADTAANQFIRGQAEYELAYIAYLQEDYTRSTAAFKRIRVLYRDYPQIQNKAQFHYILSLINSGALKEAQLTLWEVQSQLSDEQILIINDLLDTQR